MKKYLKYELKKNLLPMIVLTVLSTVIYLAAVLSTDFIRTYYGYPYDGTIITSGPTGELLYLPIFILTVLCTLVPVFMFSFKMRARQVDCFYSFSLSRRKMYIVKSIVGLIMTLAPYTICYWLGFIATAIKPNMFQLWAFVPAYFISIPMAVLLFGINAFAFTRANSIWDGMIFMAFYACAGCLFIYYVNMYVRWYFWNYGAYGSHSGIISEYWFTYSPLTAIMSKYTEALSGGKYWYGKEIAQTYIFAIITGIAAWAGLIMTANKEKAENAERVSDSWFGYRVFIPFYIAFMVPALTGLDFWSAVLYVTFIAACGVVLFIIFRRSFKLKAVDWYFLAGAIALGIILSLIANNLPAKMYF